MAFQTIDAADVVEPTGRGKINANFATAINKDGSVPFTGNQSMGSNRLTSVLDPTSAQDAATKNYTDTHTLIPKVTAWPAALTLSGVGTTADTDVDVSANVPATATAAILLVKVTSSNVSNATFVSFRKKGDSGVDGSWQLVYSPPVNGYIVEQLVIVQLDASKKFTYSVNANAASFSATAWVVGSICVTPA